jgi:hypothetical protein
MEQFLDTRVEPLKVGDIIFAYHSGFHRIVKIGENKEYPNHPYIEVSYQTVVNSKYQKIKGKSVYSCNSYYCGKVDKASIKTLTDALQEQIDTLNGFVTEFNLQ